MADTKLRREDEIDQRANAMFNSHPDLQQMEQDAGKSLGDEAENYAHANDSANPENSWTGKPTNNSMGNIDAIKDKETTPNWEQNYTGKGANKSTGFTMKNFVKKKGPAGAILALLLGGGVIGTSLLSPALLLVHMKNVFMNDLSDSTPASSMRSDLMMRNKIKGLNVTTAICTNSVSIRCKFSTMSDRQIKKFEKAGFSFEDKGKSTIQKIGLRSSFSSMTFDPGDGRPLIKISNPQDMKNLARTPEGRAALNKAFNPKTDFFLNGDFSKMLATKLGISKESKVKPGDEKEVKSTFDESTGADKAAPPEEGGRYKTALDESNKVKGLSGGAAALAGFSIVCQAYSSSSLIVHTVKYIKLASAAAFAMTFLTETDKLIAGDADPSVISTLGNQLTSTDNRKQIKDDNGNMVNNPDYGKSPTDSQGYQLAANGTAAHEDSADKFSLAPTAGALALLATIVAFPYKFNAGPVSGRTAFKSVCGVANSLAGQALGVIAQCAEALAGTPLAYAGCLAVAAVSGAVIGKLLGMGIEKIISYIIQEYGKGLALDAATYGPDVGNGYFLGASAILGGMAGAMGMMPANASSLKSYFADTDSIRKQNTAADVYLAKATPFDVYNQYSFLGSIVQPINATLLSQSSVASKVAGLFNLIPSSFASIGTAGAAYNEAAQPFNPQRFSQCQDQDLADIGVTGDEFCNVRYTMSSNELNMDSDQNVQYMVNNGVVDENTGAPRTDTQMGQDYQKFLDNCANRVDPIGSSAKGYDADDWDTGKNCGPESSVDPTELSNFRVFTMDMQTEDAMDQDPSAGSGSGSTTSTPSGNLPTGSTQDLMKQLLASPNIQFQTPQEKSYAEEIAQTGHATQCGGPAISPLLLSYLVYASQQFKLTIGVFTDGHGCGDGFHDRGIAVDLNGIADANQPFVQSIAGSGTSQGGGSYTDKAESQEIVKFEMYLDAVAQPKNLRFNQSGCVQRNGVTPAKTINAINYNFDSCTHLHMDTWIGGAGVPAGG